MKITFRIMNTEKDLYESLLEHNSIYLKTNVDSAKIEFISVLYSGGISITLDKEPECICLDKDGGLWIGKPLILEPKILWEKAKPKEEDKHNISEFLDCIS